MSLPDIVDFDNEKYAAEDDEKAEGERYVPILIEEREEPPKRKRENEKKHEKEVIKQIRWFFGCGWGELFADGKVKTRRGCLFQGEDDGR